MWQDDLAYLNIRIVLQNMSTENIFFKLRDRISLVKLNIFSYLIGRVL
jgi:hypothetical protein